MWKFYVAQCVPMSHASFSFLLVLAQTNVVIDYWQKQAPLTSREVDQMSELTQDYGNVRVLYGSIFKGLWQQLTQ